MTADGRLSSMNLNRKSMQGSSCRRERRSVSPPADRVKEGGLSAGPANTASSSVVQTIRAVEERLQVARDAARAPSLRLMGTSPAMHQTAMSAANAALRVVRAFYGFGLDRTASSSAVANGGKTQKLVLAGTPSGAEVLWYRAISERT